MLEPPTPEAWAFAKWLGFRSDGCTGVPDYLIWSGLAIANSDDRWPLLPCNRHDLRYFIGGDELAKATADAELFLGIVEVSLNEPPGAKRELGLEQARIYFNGVREAADHAWKKHREPCVPRFWG